MLFRSTLRPTASAHLQPATHDSAEADEFGRINQVAGWLDRLRELDDAPSFLRLVGGEYNL